MAEFVDYETLAEHLLRTVPKLDTNIADWTVKNTVYTQNICINWSLFACFVINQTEKQKLHSMCEILKSI